ncbi:hexameric tyrosine-coordinated heme protein [Bradyrhizobium betae]|uniref:Uncharacterized protein n=1 Tax=Bradyrhizobium betae TaxID=244734 RepID=A0A5P6P0J6_9BRAD|nr:hexameric tyrosine-coordinated heme protein [Bradyrhizobium betae]QFI71706.1 hypothetical protein F8237_04560 [Bradyrhizobium betae]
MGFGAAGRITVRPLIATSHVIAVHFQTVATANNWRR